MMFLQIAMVPEWQAARGIKNNPTELRRKHIIYLFSYINVILLKTLHHRDLPSKFFGASMVMKLPY